LARPQAKLKGPVGLCTRSEIEVLDISPKNRSQLATPATMGTLYTLLIGVAALPVVACAQQSVPTNQLGIPYDWSHHHLVFSQPSAASDILKRRQEPRYWQQWYRRNIMNQVPIADSGSLEASTADVGSPLANNGRPAAHKDWSVSLGSAATVGGVNYPAKYSFYTSSASCSSDLVVFNTGLAGSSSPAQATIIAFTNLYTGCGGTVPTVHWQYNTAYPQGNTTADGSKIVTSVVLSYFGDQVAFVQSNSSNVASLVILRWAHNSSLVNLNSATNNVAPANYWNCTAPCMTTLTLSGSHNDTNSSPFYDYANDVLYVGDDSGVLHKFQRVFKSTSGNPPAEVSTGWPVAISTSKLTAPVFDGGTSQRVFVGDAAGFLYSVKTDGTSKNTSQQLAKTGSKGIVDAPLVDSTQQTVYVFVGQDNEGSTNPCGNSTTGCNGVFQFSTGFTSASTLVESVMGVGNASTVIYAGDFDQKYYSNPPNGNLYVCAATVTPIPKLDYIPISSNISLPSVATDAIKPLASGTSSVGCSPVTEIYNGSTDLIFLSVTASGNQSGCTGACVYSFNVTSSAPSSAAAGLVSAGGSSGITIDNIVTPGSLHTSQIYFSTLGTGSCGGGCAVQASQAALN
jgi:hypothetical protein